MMKPTVEHEDQPFMGYSDDPVGPPQQPPPSPLDSPSPPTKRTNCCRDVLIFVLAALLISVFWAAATVFFPHIQIYLSPPSSSSSFGISSLDPATVALINQPIDTSRLHNVTSGARFIECGKSADEARAHGCLYDPLIQNWVAPQCFDREILEMYYTMNGYSWEAYEDEALTKRIPPQDMGDYKSYYTTPQNHINHCAMLWRKQFRILFEERGVFDGIIFNQEHMNHCFEFLRNPLKVEWSLSSKIWVGYSGCWVRDGQHEL